MAATTTLETNARNALADALDTLVNTGSGTAQLMFEEAGDGEVATCDMADPAFGAAATGVITNGTIQDDTNARGTAAAGGVVAQVSMYNKAGTKVAEFNCGVTDETFIISSTTVGAGDTVGVSSFTITVPA